MAQTKFDRDIYEAALLGYEQSKLDIEKKIAELRNILSGSSASVAAQTQKKATTTRRKLSESARKRIAEAQRKRWARFRRQQAQGKSGAVKSGTKG